MDINVIGAAIVAFVLGLWLGSREASRVARVKYDALVTQVRKRERG